MEKPVQPGRPQRLSWINTLCKRKPPTPPQSTGSSEGSTDALETKPVLYWNNRLVSPPKTPDWLRQPIESLQNVDSKYGHLHESAHCGITEVSIAKAPDAFVKVLDRNADTFASVLTELNENPSDILQRFHPGLSEFDNVAVLALLRPIRELCQLGTTTENDPGRKRVATLLVMLVLRNRHVTYQLARIASRDRWRFEHLIGYLTNLHSSELMKQANGGQPSSEYVPLFLERLKKTMAKHTQMTLALWDEDLQASKSMKQQGDTSDPESSDLPQVLRTTLKDIVQSSMTGRTMGGDGEGNTVGADKGSGH